MNKKLLGIVQSNQSVIALYDYAITKETMIPVIIVERYSEAFAEALRHDDNPGRIILTQDDLKHGHDVYSVTLNHIIRCSRLVYGTELLKDISISKQELRPHLEGQIRHTLIDIREGLAQGKRLGDLLPWLSIQCDRIRHACGFLLGTDTTIADIVEQMNQEWFIDHTKLYKTLHHGTGVVDLYGVHEDLSLLVAHIDLLFKNTTK